MAKTSQEKLLIGAHCSTSGGLENALFEGEKIGATTVQLFTSNQKQWKGREITDEMAEIFLKTQKETGIQKIMSHNSYLINLGSPKPELLEKSRTAFKEEIKRCHKLRLAFLNFHPGAATGSSIDDCLNTIIQSLKTFSKVCEKGNTCLLLETTAGQGSSVGHEFEHLAMIIEGVKGHVPIGVCIDTCHIFSAGYDIRTPKAWESTLKKFEEIIGLKYLQAFHLNDSLKPFHSRRDRHANLGEGEIGLNAFKYMMENSKLRQIPKYLETPMGSSRWKNEISLLRKLAK